MTKKTMTLAILSALCAAPLFAAAQHAKGPAMGHGAERFARLDADHNGTIGADEMKAEVARRFASFDQNKDGRVSQQEAETFIAAKRGKHMAGRGADLFTRLDTNHDGAVDKAEIEAQAKERFERKDADHNGVLTGNELGRHHGEACEGKHHGNRDASAHGEHR